MFLVNLLGKSKDVVAMIATHEVQRGVGDGLDMEQYRFVYRWPNRIEVYFIEIGKPPKLIGVA